MGDQQGRPPGQQRQGEVDGPPAGVGVQPLEGLVQQHQRRGEQQRTGQGDPPPHTAAEFPDGLIRRMVKAQRCQGAGNGSFPPGVLLQHAAQAVRRAQLGWQPVLLENHCDATLRNAVNAARIRRFQPGDQPQQRGLAAA